MQAFLNILDNSIKHSLLDSTVFIVGKIEGVQVAVEIRDRGQGISQSDPPHIFEQFYTADRSRQGSGTGLGLAIARRIVEAHGGAIAASSKGEGKGAIFTIRLPFDKPSGTVFFCRLDELIQFATVSPWDSAMLDYAQNYLTQVEGDYHTFCLEMPLNSSPD